jgi:hypothetical protein
LHFVDAAQLAEAAYPARTARGAGAERRGVEKTPPFRLHNATCDVDLLDQSACQAVAVRRITVMKKMFLIALLASSALAFTGCNSCNRPRLFGWFNRGSACDPCMDGYDGGADGWIPRSAGMMPSGPTAMPEPIEVMPAN